MNRELLDRILSCQTLPSLPAVALRVLELTRDRDVRLETIAETVQNDPALAAKVLKTVNSSYFGLARPCTTIKRALGYLGLNAVKSLVLGFSLVDCTRSIREEDGFDLTEFWTRTIFSATAARRLAALWDRVDPEEAFTAALFQDIGMLAAFVGARQKYGAMLADAPGDHEDLPALEANRLSLTHAVVGAELTARWKLPEQYTKAVRLHHEPERAPEGVVDLVRLVVLGRLASYALAPGSTGGDCTRLIRRAGEWFGPIARPEEVLGAIAEDAKGLAKLFEKRVNNPPDIGALLAQAADALVQHQISIEQEAVRLREEHRHLEEEAHTDALTGVANRRRLDQVLCEAFEDANARSRPLTLIFCDADRFKAINDTLGHAAGDAVLVELARRLKGEVGSSGVVARYGGEEFAIVLPGVGADGAPTWAERLRRCVADTPFDLTGSGGDAAQSVTISLGVAVHLPGSAGAFPDTESLVRSADKGVYAAKAAGRNRVGFDTPQSAAASAGGGAGCLLLVEDDPLAAGLLRTAFARVGGVEVRWCASVGAVRDLLAREPGFSPGLVVTDLRLGGSTAEEVVSAIRNHSASPDAPIVLISCQEDSGLVERCKRAGAAAFYPKDRVCQNVTRWVQTLITTYLKRRAA